MSPRNFDFDHESSRKKANEPREHKSRKPKTKPRDRDYSRRSKDDVENDWMPRDINYGY